MADLSITAANVVSGDNAIIKDGSAGEAVAAGKVVYKSPVSKKWMLADSNSGTAAAREATGIALNGAALDQPLRVQTGGDLVLGATLTPGTSYYLSDTPGGVCPLADVGSGEYVCQLGLAKSPSVLALDIQFPNVAL